MTEMMSGAEHVEDPGPETAPNGLDERLVDRWVSGPHPKLSAIPAELGRPLASEVEAPPSAGDPPSMRGQLSGEEVGV